MATYAEVPLHENAVPIPRAYTRTLAYDVSAHNPISYDYLKNQYYNPNASSERGPSKRDAISTISEYESLYKEVEEETDSSAKFRKPMFRYLKNSRLWIRTLTIMVMITSASLILTAIIKFNNAKNAPGQAFNNIPQPAPITDHPCIVFTGIAVMNLLLSITVWTLSCCSTSFHIGYNTLNAIFTILGAVGFASSMGACFFLNRASTLQNDLWKWSCANHRNGVHSDVLDFNLICGTIGQAWKLGLLQASLDLLTFLVSITTFFYVRWIYSARYGFFGKASSTSPAGVLLYRRRSRSLSPSPYSSPASSPSLAQT